MQLSVSGAAPRQEAPGQASPSAGYLGLFPLLALTSALGVLLVSASYAMSRYGNMALEALFLPGLLLIYVPPLVRLFSPATPRVERIALLVLVGMCCLLVQLMISPLYISPYDAMLHWISADNILRTQHLYAVNSLLPVSPYYPGLEIVTNALSSIAGLTTFQSSTLVIAAARLLMTLSLFLFYEQLTVSSRVAGIATMIYMTNPHFLFFDAIFSYETLALPFASFILYLLARYSMAGDRNTRRWLLAIAWPALAVLTVTHHMTDYVLVCFLLLWTIVSLARGRSRGTSPRSSTAPADAMTAGGAAPRMRGVLAIFAFSGLLFALAYALLVPGNPVWTYLSSYFRTAFDELIQALAGTGAARQLFSAQGVAPAPIWDRLIMLGSVGFVTLGLPFGLYALWKQHRLNCLAVTLAIVSLAYPVTQVFRFTNNGSDITDRSAAFLFIPISFVLALCVTYPWPIQRLSRYTPAIIACATSVMLLGGALLESGPAYSGLPGPYMVIAGGRSVEPIGVEAALWSLSHLGPGNRVATDRVDQTIFGTFGEQRIVTPQQDHVNVALIFYSSSIDLRALGADRVRYLVVDLRTSTALPLLGYYYGPDDPGAFHYTSPISRQALTKFGAVPQINQLFDDGDIIIYGVDT